MAIRHMTYLELTPQQRREGAAKARTRLMPHLQVPWVAPEQKALIEAELAKVAAWEQGRLPVVHTLRLVEEVPSEETLG